MPIETPEYKIISKHEGFEVRRYSDMVIATTKVQADYKNSTSSGFRRIASYIFGGNDKEMKIAMTAPVISTQLDMEEETHEVLFVMPREHQFDKLPRPNLQSVQLEERRLSKVAAISFGGWATAERATYYEQQLKEEVEKLGLEIYGEYMVAQYNSPWAIPPFRKNEIIIQVR